MRLLILCLILACGLTSCVKTLCPKGANGKSFGIDVSSCQGNIDWARVAHQKKHKEIEYAIIRSDMGDNRKDCKFKKNFAGAKKAGLIVGAYHYYDPNENSSAQAQNYLNSVKLQKGDIKPIVDLEYLSQVQSTPQLKAGLQNWLNIVEKRYGVKPIIYTGYDYWNKNLKSEFGEYPIWIAAYSTTKRESRTVKRSVVHQFSQEVRVDGITGYVDGDDADLDEIVL